MAAYALAGTFATVAGLIFAAVATSGDANGTGGYTLVAIAAAIIGGCSFSGGRVSPVGVVIAGVLLTLVAIFLTAISVPPVFTAASQGALLLAVMAVRRIPAFQTEAR
jgi:ribose transport system ATP-binding protein